MYLTRISNISNTNFRANYFTVDKKQNSRYLLTKISTDNEENLGAEPVLQYEYKACDSSIYKMEEPMVYDGKYYTSYCSPYIFKYRIYYKDTDKYENNGKEQFINASNYTKKAMMADRISNNLLPESAIAKGSASGYVAVNTSDVPKDVPVILILDEIRTEQDIYDIPENVCGVIVSFTDTGLLQHASNQIRNNFSAMSIICDDDKYNDLTKYEGKYLSIDNSSGVLKYKQIPPASYKPQIHEKVNVPKLEHVERLLTFDELTPQNCGNKGYRLKILQDLVREGKLKNIKTLGGFVVPEGYINNLL